MSLSDWVNLLQHGGPWVVLAAFVAVVLYSGRRGVWVWGREAERERQRADKYEALYDGTRVLLQQSLDTAEANVDTLKAQVALLERIQQHRRETAT